MQEIVIHTEFIQLNQLLKLAGCEDQGSEAKFLIEGGKVKVNGITASERGKKIRDQDKIAVDGMDHFIVKYENIHA